MKDQVREFKMWWAWDDREHEQWLAERSRMGLHLRKVSMLGLLHHFEPGAPANISYRWDYQTDGGKRDYRQLFTDDGWKLVGDVAGGWLCWSKPVGTGPEPEIFTDRASLRQKYRNLLGVLAVTSLPLLPMVASNRGIWRDLAAGGTSGIVAGGFLALGVAFALLGLYGSLRIWRRMREI